MIPDCVCFRKCHKIPCKEKEQSPNSLHLFRGGKFVKKKNEVTVKVKCPSIRLIFNGIYGNEERKCYLNLDCQMHSFEILTRKYTHSSCFDTHQASSVCDKK